MKKLGKGILIGIAALLLIVVVLVAAVHLLRPEQPMGELARHAKLPEEYLITYQVAQEDGTIVETSLGQDADGNLYYLAEDGQESFYAPSGSGYLLYRTNLNGEFVQTDDTLYTEDHVQEAVKPFQEYVQKSDLRFSESAAPQGEEEFAGRTCDVYEIDMTLGALEQKNTLAVDQESGVCLLWDVDSQLDGYQISSEGSFACVSFETNRVQLPGRADE